MSSNVTEYDVCYFHIGAQKNIHLAIDREQDAMERARYLANGLAAADGKVSVYKVVTRREHLGYYYTPTRPSVEWHMGEVLHG